MLLYCVVLLCIVAVMHTVLRSCWNLLVPDVLLVFSYCTVCLPIEISMCCGTLLLYRINKYVLIYSFVVHIVMR